MIANLPGWFPLVPRPRPCCRALSLRVTEIRCLADEASRKPDDTLLVTAAEALNKAALLASDCGLPDLARQLCWRQFDLFQAAVPLTAKVAKLALQPLINLGRLAIRDGDGLRAYRTFRNAHQAMTARTDTEIDGRSVNFERFVSPQEDRRDVRRFLWVILLADGTRALTSAGLWADALGHVQRYRGIGTRMLDGRQVAVLAHCAAGEPEAALRLLDESSLPEPWEKAVASCLRVLCLRVGERAADAAAIAMVKSYLALEPSPGHVVFRARLGLTVISLATDVSGLDPSPIIDRVVSDAVTNGDAYSAADVLSHDLCRSMLTEADEQALRGLVATSGLRRGSMRADLLDLLLTSVTTAEAQLARALT